jgi:hypothetical protein
MKGQKRRKGKGHAYYSCKFHAPSTNAAGHVCHAVRYFSEVLEAAVTDALRDLAESPNSVQAAFAAFAARQKAASGDADERDRLQADLATRDKREWPP